VSAGGKLIFVIALGLTSVGAGLLVGKALRAEGPPAPPISAAPGPPPTVVDAAPPPAEPPPASPAAPLEPAAPLLADDLVDDELLTGRAPFPSLAAGRRLRAHLAQARRAEQPAGRGPEDAAAPAAATDAPAPIAEPLIPEAPRGPEDAGPPDAGPAADAGAAPRAVATAPPPVEEVPRAPLVVTFEDGLSSWLRLVALEIHVDGKRVFAEKSEAGLDRSRRARLYEGKLFPGHHQVRVEAQYVGNGGLFSYMDAYRVKLREVIVLEVRKGGSTLVNVTTFDRGALEAWEKRAGMRLSAAER
jgi:hypothetical protein